ncbi:MAG: hypothetical protein ACHQCE_21745, partial [Streptosporangiales bacterium]
QVMAQRRIVQRPQRADPPGQARPGHLEDPLSATQVLQAMLAQIRSLIPPCSQSASSSPTVLKT